MWASTSQLEFGHSATSSSHHQGNNQPDNENLMELSPTKSGENATHQWSEEWIKKTTQQKNDQVKEKHQTQHPTSQKITP